MEQPHEHPVEDSQNLLKIGIGLTIFIFFLEFFGGLWTHSLALLSDAWHIFLDIWSLIVSFLALYLAKRPVNARRTYGLHRMEVLAALFNGFVVFFIALGILIAAIHRFNHPQPVRGESLLWIAGIGLLLNSGIAFFFYRRSQNDLNMRGAFLHVLGDALNTLAVLIAAFLMLITKFHQIDPMVSVLIAAIILWGSGRLLRESLNTLLEGAPKGIRVTAVEQEIMRIEGVLSVHDLHVWSICSHLSALSGHVLLGPECMPSQHMVLDRISQNLKDHFGIAHTTIQVESNAWVHSETVLREHRVKGA